LRRYFCDAKPKKAVPLIPIVIHFSLYDILRLSGVRSACCIYSCT
jgi:hypothetical protein